MSGPMSGVRVVSVAGYAFVTSATAILADLGADAIKVEPLGGDTYRDLVGTGEPGVVTAGEVWVEFPNRSTRSLSIDLASPSGREVLLDLVRTADVFLTSYLEPTRRQLGIDVDDIRAINPQVIYGRGSGWGVRGPMKDLPAYDMVSAWAGSGLVHIVGGIDGAPPPMPFGVFDTQAGSALAGAIGMALYQRAATGKASVVDVSLLNVGWWSIQAEIEAAPFVGDDPYPARTSPPNPLINSYRTCDGRWLYVALPGDSPHWPELCARIGRPELASDARFTSLKARARHVGECVRVLDAAFAAATLDEWRQRLDGFAGAWAPVLTPAEVHGHPQAGPNGFLFEHESSSGARFQLVAAPMQFDEQPSRSRSSAPTVGQHSVEILRELGYEASRIDALIEAGSVRAS